MCIEIKAGTVEQRRFPYRGQGKRKGWKILRKAINNLGQEYYVSPYYYGVYNNDGAEKTKNVSIEISIFDEDYWDTTTGFYFYQNMDIARASRDYMNFSGIKHIIAEFELDSDDIVYANITQMVCQKITDKFTIVEE